MSAKSNLRVLVADKMSAAAPALLQEAGIAADVKTGMTRDELIACIDTYDGLIVRSATKVTPPVIAAAKRLKVIGRAGIGVDNIDVPAATAKGIAVVNTPWGNSVTTAEHALALLVSLARHIPDANVSTHAGKWEKSKFEGVEVSGKQLGIIGCGNVGSIMANRALGLKMKVAAYDPYLTEERAQELGVDKMELDALLAASDFISLHAPLTDKTRHIMNAQSLAKAKAGVRIINCARGELIDDAAMVAALKSGHVAGAAFDVYVEEPAKESPYFGMPNVICTPHLGASTREAQENVARQAASYLADYLQHGIIHAAINLPSTGGSEARHLRPYILLGGQLGEFLGQMVESAVSELEIEYAGEVQTLNRRALSLAILAGFLRPQLSNVNAVNAPDLARARGLTVSEKTSPSLGAFDTYIRLAVKTARAKRSIAGTLFSDKLPRIIQLMGLDVKADWMANMLYVTNEDKPGFIGALGTVLGRHGVNIGSFNLGRAKSGRDAIALLGLDARISDAALAEVQALENVVETRRLSFSLL